MSKRVYCVSITRVFYLTKNMNNGQIKYKINFICVKIFENNNKIINNYLNILCFRYLFI